jgi:RNA-directed DNA polymerase
VDVGEMQKKLRQWAQENPTEQRRDLYSLLCNELWLRVAHHHVNSNQGRETAGIDSITMSNFHGNLAGNLERLKEALKAKTFEPMPVRRVYIPKPNGKKRPLGIPMFAAYCISYASLLGIVLAEPVYVSQFPWPQTLSLLTVPPSSRITSASQPMRCASSRRTLEMIRRRALAADG